MYVFYESFYYRNNTSTRLSKSIYVNQVTCHENGSERLFNKLCRIHSSVNVSSNKRFDKIYIRRRARLIRVNYNNQSPHCNPVLADKWVENYLLGYEKRIVNES